MRIYFVRHGQSLDAANKCYQRPTSPLTDKGIKQAEFLGQELANFDFNKILSSPLARAKQTAEIINKKLKLPIEYLDFLQEEKRPSHIEGKSKLESINMDIVKIIQRNYADSTYRHSDEDTFEILKSRAIQMQHAFELLPDENYLIISHGTILKMFWSLLLIGDVLSPDLFLRIDRILEPQNAGIAVFEYLDNRWKILHWNLLKF